MDIESRLRALGAVAMFAPLGAERLKSLAPLLAEKDMEDGRSFIVEGEPGDGLYIVVSGRVRVAKRLGEGGDKDLAFFGPGDCLGEMEISVSGPRSASAYAVGRVSLLQLKTADLRAWLEKDPAAAALFFEGLAVIQFGRLRRTSDEVALLYDLSRLLVSAQAAANDLLRHAVERTAPHLQGAWSSEARAYNPFDNEMNLVGRHGPAFGSDGAEPAPTATADLSWTDDRTIQLILRAPKRLLGLMRFRAAEALDEAKRVEAERTLSAVSRLLASALENIDFRNDEMLRERLKARSHG